jgi:hypothetical protein
MGASDVMQVEYVHQGGSGMTHSRGGQLCID